MVRKYFYEVFEEPSRSTGKPLTRVYIAAKPRFSHREMFSKQEQLLDRITDTNCPLTGAMRIAVMKDMHVAVLCIAKVDIDRVVKSLELDFVHSLEIVALNPLDVQALVEWLSGFWKGEWNELKRR